jgi:putative tryptophan/tyrosine transport system substrate-binding protein
MKRREFIAFLAATAWSHDAMGQRPEKTRRIVMITGIAETDPEGQARMAALQEGLRDLGWIAGQNLLIEYRWGAGDEERTAALAKEAVELQPDLIIGATTPVITALLQQSRTIPIVFVQVIDPVGRGFLANLARPSGNVTGFMNFEFSMGGKWLETLKQVAPAVKRVAVLFNPNTAPFATSFVEVAQAASTSFATQIIATPVLDVEELEQSLAAFVAKPDAGLIVMPDAFTTRNRQLIVALAARHRLPAIYPFRYFAVSGGLISDGVDTSDVFRRSAAYVDRILKGTKPGELPVQAPVKFELVINLKTAKALGLEVPPTVLARADEVIE